MRRCAPASSHHALLAAVLVLLATAGAASAARTPVVFFPGYGTTILKVTVHGRTTVKGCPASDPHVLARLLRDLRRPGTRCG